MKGVHGGGGIQYSYDFYILKNQMLVFYLANIELKI